MELTAGISLNLGIFNLLPIPILDGGVIMFLLIEGPDAARHQHEHRGTGVPGSICVPRAFCRDGDLQRPDEDYPGVSTTGCPDRFVFLRTNPKAHRAVGVFVFHRILPGGNRRLDFGAHTLASPANLNVGCGSCVSTVLGASCAGIFAGAPVELAVKAPKGSSLVTPFGSALDRAFKLRPHWRTSRKSVSRTTARTFRHLLSRPPRGQSG